MAWDWKVLIPGYGLYRAFKNTIDNINTDGFQMKDLLGWYGYQQTAGEGHQSTVSDNITEALNDHNIASEPDVNGYQQVDINPADPTSSASNVINYDPAKSSQENLLGYAQANNSASAYQQYLANQYSSEMANSAISRAIADAEANGISKYQLFQSGNAAASSPSSGSSLATSYENAMNRRESWNEKELNAIVKIITTTVSSALGILGK